MTALNTRTSRLCSACWNFPSAKTSARWGLLGLGVGAFIIAMLAI